ncbi:MAG TPA: Wzz/FepE/Etk N-terminal domain-containing protein [Armatimonadota bacterium]|jgi:uncharacterized protein involved in exopolysaccharide biosynthesis
MYEINFEKTLRGLLRQWKIILGATVGGVLLVGIITVFFLPRTWEASALLMMGNQAPTSTASALLSGLTGGALSSLPGMSSSGPTTDVFEALLRSWDTRMKVADKCGLQKALDTTRPEDAADALGKLAQVDTQPPTSVTITIDLKGTPRGLFPSDKDDQQVRQLTVQVANTYIDLLKSQLDGLRITSAKSQRVFLEKQMPLARKDFYTSQRLLAAWQAQHHIPAPPKAGELLATELSTVQQDLTTSEVAQQVQAQTAQRTRQLLGKQAQMVTSASTQQQNPQIQALSTALAGVEQQLSEQQTFYHKTKDHPDVQRLLVERETLLQQLRESYKQGMLPASVTMARSMVYDQLLGGLLTAEVTQLAEASKSRGLRAVMAQGKQMIEKLSWSSLEYAQLYEEVQIKQAIYETVIKQYEAAVLNEKAEEPVFFVTDPAVVPYKKAGPSTVMNGAVGVLLGLLVGLAWAGLRMRREDSEDPRGAATTSASGKDAA